MRSFLVGAGLISVLASPALAKKKAAPTAPAAKASAQTTRAIEELMGKYKWGMSRKEVATAIEENVRAEYEERMKQAADAWDQQKLRDEMMARIKEFQGSYFEFTGKKTGWDVSIIDAEFAHNNDESMQVAWERDQRRFFFFFHGQLYKMFVALNAEKFKGKTFDEFTRMMQDRYGPAETRYTPKRTGEAVVDRLVWPQAGRTELQAVDRSAFYGNFCLNLLDKGEADKVAQGREVNSPKAAGGDPEVEAALRESGVTKDTNEDIVDRITRRQAQGPKAGTGDEGMADPSAPRTEVRPAEPASAAASDKRAAKKDVKGKKEPKHAEPRKKKRIGADPLDGKNP
jgi:hypothetical protein